MSYSADLRTRAVSAYKQKEGSVKQIAHRFLVSSSSLCRWVRKVRKGEALEAKSPPGRNRLVSNPQIIQQLWEQDPDAFQEEIAKRYQEVVGQKVSQSTIRRTKQRMRWSRKKSFFASEQDTERVKQI